MTREQAERERDRLAAEQPGATWIVAERDGAWQVLRVGLRPPDSAASEAKEARPKPPTADDPRSAQNQLFPPWAAG